MAKSHCLFIYLFHLFTLDSLHYVLVLYARMTYMCIEHVCVYEYRHGGAMVYLYMSGYLAWEHQGTLLSHHRSTGITNVCDTMSRFTWVLVLGTRVLTWAQTVLYTPSCCTSLKNLSLIKSSSFVFQVTAKFMRFYLWVRKRWGAGVFNKQLKDQHIIPSSFCIWL